MVKPLSIDTDGVRSLGDIHDRVSTGLGSLAAGTPESAGVATSHGTIADAVNTALAAALGSRSESMTVTGRNAQTLSELLHQAALAYERGDQSGGAAIASAADAVAPDERGGSG